MLLRMVPSKRTGSWGMMPNRDLRSWSPKVQMSTPSIIIFPSEGSTILNNAWISVDFPLPVRPTTPIFSPPCMLIVMPFNTRGVLCLYLNCRSRETNSCYFILLKFLTAAPHWLLKKYIYIYNVSEYQFWDVPWDQRHRCRLLLAS